MPCSLMRVGATKATPGSLRELLRELVDLRLAGRVRQVGGDHERAVGAGPEALGVEVVGLPGHRARRVVAGVREAEAHVERGDRQREQDQGRRDRGGPRPALDGVAPAPRERPLAARLLRQAAAEERQPPAVDPRAEVGEERGQQRDRGEHHDEHRQRGGDGDAVHVGQAGQREAEHGDHDDRAGEDHAAPGGGDRFEHRVVDGLPVGQRRRGSASGRAARSRCRRRSRSGPRPPSSSRGRRRRWRAARSGRRRRCRGRRGRSAAAGRRRPPSRRRSAARSRRRGTRGPPGWSASCAA